MPLADRRTVETNRTTEAAQLAYYRQGASEYDFWLSHVPPDRFDMVIVTCLWRDPVPDLGDRAVYHAVGEGNDDGLVLDRGFKAGRVTAGHFIS